mgnify:CR=1 FL=1
MATSSSRSSRVASTTVGAKPANPPRRADAAPAPTPPPPPPAAPAKADHGDDRRAGKKRSGEERDRLDDDRDIDSIRNKTKFKKKLKPGKAAVMPESRHGFEKPTAPIVHEVSVPATITVSDLAQRMSIKATEVIKTLMKMGVMATINQILDQKFWMIFSVLCYCIIKIILFFIMFFVSHYFNSFNFSNTCLSISVAYSGLSDKN